MMSSSKQDLDDCPLVSVVTPSYNAMPYIQENVESVREQGYRNLEHIIMDGASTDGTREYLESQSGLRCISEPDRGQSHALNKAFRLANGQIIGWLNADDTYQPGAVFTAVRFFQQYPEIDLVYSDLQIIDQADQGVGITRSQSFNLDRLLLDNFIKQPTVFMRRRVIDQLGGVDENLHFAMDREFWLRAGEAGFKMHYLEGKILANFRLIPGTKSYEQTPLFRQEWLSVLERAFQKSAYTNIPAAKKRIFLRKTKAQYHWAIVTDAITIRDRKRMLHHAWKSIEQNPGLVFNRGTWMIIAKGLFGISLDRFMKFKKVAPIPEK
jgi:glycosyltransferase involved in cell wall biosynthesis